MQGIVGERYTGKHLKDPGREEFTNGWGDKRKEITLKSYFDF